VTSINPKTLRHAIIAIAIGGLIGFMGGALTGCASNQAPPPSPTVAQLAPEPAPSPAPRITGVIILSEQPAEVQRAIQQHGAAGAWPSFKWPRERLVPYTNHVTPLTIDLAPFQDVDLSLHRANRSTVSPWAMTSAS
jgi:hypothetical protein